METNDAWKNFTPRANPPRKPVQEVSFIPDMDDGQLRKLAREKLSRALQAISPEVQPELTRKLCAELMDRLDGKPAQAINLDAEVRTVTVHAHITFADELPAQVDNKIIDHVDNHKYIEHTKA